VYPEKKEPCKAVPVTTTKTIEATQIIHFRIPSNIQYIQNKGWTSLGVLPSCVSESFYEFPRCASKKPHQSPHNTLTCASNISPSNSPTLHPQTSSSTTNSMYCDSDYYYYAIRSVPDSEEEGGRLSSSPSELLQLSRTLSKSKTRNVVPMTYLSCKETISPPPIRKKRSILANNFFAHYL
ncbi:17932_t:CDS:2, partial [Acaulospora morrowiae]